jgi:protein-S-isoprenylcysteine O-methyltransferase Ste14
MGRKPIPLPLTFPWHWWVSALIAVLIALPFGYLMWRGIKDAGTETMTPKKEHTLYGGIYEKIRHPQAVGEVAIWWVMAFLLHSPFLALFSFAWLPVWAAFCWAEERDLVLRYGEAYEAYRRRTPAFIPKRQREG